MVEFGTLTVEVRKYVKLIGMVQIKEIYIICTIQGGKIEWKRDL